MYNFYNLRALTTILMRNVLYTLAAICMAFLVCVTNSLAAQTPLWKEFPYTLHWDVAKMDSEYVTLSAPAQVLGGYDYPASLITMDRNGNVLSSFAGDSGQADFFWSKDLIPLKGNKNYFYHVANSAHNHLLFHKINKNQNIIINQIDFRYFHHNNILYSISEIQDHIYLHDSSEILLSLLGTAIDSINATYASFGGLIASLDTNLNLNYVKPVNPFLSSNNFHPEMQANKIYKFNDKIYFIDFYKSILGETDSVGNPTGYIDTIQSFYMMRNNFEFNNKIFLNYETHSASFDPVTKAQDSLNGFSNFYDISCIGTVQGKAYVQCLTPTPNGADYDMTVGYITAADTLKALRTFPAGISLGLQQVFADGDSLVFFGWLQKGVDRLQSVMFRTDSLMLDMGGFWAQVGGQVFQDSVQDCARTYPEKPHTFSAVRVTDSVNNLHYYAWPDASGQYQLYCDSGDVVVDIALQSPYLDTTACGGVSNLHLGQALPAAVENFPLTELHHCPLMQISQVALTRYCVGSRVTFSYQNLGTDTARNAFVTIAYDTAYMALDSGSLPIIQASGLTTIPLGNVPPGGFSTVYLWGAATCDTALFGDTTLVVAHIYPDSLCVPSWPFAAFVDSSHTRIVGAWDPNEKLAEPFGTGSRHEILPDGDIAYTIHFQNTGLAAASRVLLLDTLPATLDPATIRPGASSHPYTFDLSGPGVASFLFDPIVLPDSNANEPASHGWVKFRIRQRPGLADNTEISNRAAIYFDFNPAVITDPVVRTVQRRKVGVEAPIIPELRLFPNPARTQVALALPQGGALHTLTATDMQGRTLPVAHHNGTFDIHTWQPGVYLIRATLQSGQSLGGRLVVIP